MVTMGTRGWILSVPGMVNGAVVVVVMTVVSRTIGY